MTAYITCTCINTLLTEELSCCLDHQDSVWCSFSVLRLNFSVGEEVPIHTTGHTSRLSRCSTHFCHCLPRDTIRFNRLRLQSYNSCPLPSSEANSKSRWLLLMLLIDLPAIDWKFQWPCQGLQRPVASPSCYLYFWLGVNQSSQDLFLRFS